MTQFRLTARGLIDRPEISPQDIGDENPTAAESGKRQIFVEGLNCLSEAQIYDFDLIQSGNVLNGPAVIHTPITTIVIQDKQTGRMDAYRNIILEDS